MSKLSSAVSLHPYFQIHPGKIEEFVANFSAFVEKTATEDDCLYYDFSINGDEVFCREAYVDADAALFHLQNVTEPLNTALEISTLTRLEIHGPEAEIDKMRGPLASLNPAFFVLRAGLRI